MNYLYDYNSKFQRIQIEKEGFQTNEHTLYLDDAWQYCSMYEFRYHETMVIPSLCSAEALSRILICGGGDGLVAREALRFPNIIVDLAEIDPEMIRLYREDKILRALNKDSLHNPNLQISIGDAVEFARKTPNKYDVIFLDFPSHNDSNAEKGYLKLMSPEITNIFLSILQPWGILTAQTGMVPDDMVPYIRNLINQDYYAWNYDATYNRAGKHDNFTTVCKRKLSQQRPIPQQCRLITPAHIKVGFGEITRASEEHLDYYRLFEYVEGYEYEPSF